MKKPTNSQWCPLIWWNGSVVPLEAATISVTSETALRGVNVFEGLRVYCCPSTGRRRIPGLDAHLARLSASSEVLQLVVPGLVGLIRDGIFDLIGMLADMGDLYLRPTIYLNEGPYTSDPSLRDVGAFVAARPVDTGGVPAAITCAVSTWRRMDDLTLPPTTKVGAAYAAFRLARLEAVTRGAEEAILLNGRGTVAETGGACIFVVKNGHVATPPLEDGVLDGVTRRISIEILEEHLGVEVQERSVLRSELYVADEVFVCGTLDEIRPVRDIDSHAMREAPGPITSELSRLYIAACRGETHAVAHWFWEG